MERDLDDDIRETNEQSGDCIESPEPEETKQTQKSLAEKKNE